MGPRPVALVTIALGLPAALAAQDQFGRDVAVRDGHVFVLKPSTGRGLAAVQVFARTADETWTPVQVMRSPRGAETGEGFGSSFGVSTSLVLVASGDPENRWGAVDFRRAGGSDWNAGSGLPVGGTAAPREGPIDLGTVMRILQPPRRVVAVDGSTALVAALGGTNAGVRIYTAAGDAWEAGPALEVEGVTARDQFGGALALSGDVAVVGAPRNGASGTVFVFARREGSWVLEGTLRPELPAGSGFGTALAIDDRTIVVGAPGTRETGGVVIAFGKERTGTWSERSRVGSTSERPGEEFGGSLATGSGELWVGAPGANERRGHVYRFQMDGDFWRPASLPEIPGLDARWGFGSAIAISETVAAVGAPGAHGFVGRVAVFRRSAGGGWDLDAWLTPGGDLVAMTEGEVRCVDGVAGRFPCSEVDLLAYLPPSALGATEPEGVSDLWGWTDPETGREYALVGRTGGLAIVDVTSPAAPVFMGLMPANRSGARDIKVYRDHAFMTGDGAGDHGLLVFDLTRLRSVASPPATFEPDAKYEGITSAHNLVINTTSGFAFPVGASGGGQTCGGGLHMVDIREPTNPTFAGCYTDTEGLIAPGRTHDAQCVVYEGPDQAYQGRDICFVSNETALRIVDVSDTDNPNPISKATYPGLSYVHQGWLTDDQRYFYLDDELDELVGQSGGRTRTIIWDLADLEDPVLIGEFLGATAATDHNLYIKGDRMYQANYQAGFRVIDISDRANPVEVGFFDTTPYEGNPPGFNGAWSAFPYFASGTVIVSSMREGLFILRPRPALVP